MRFGMGICVIAFAAGTAFGAEPVRMELEYVRLENPSEPGYSYYGHVPVHLDRNPAAPPMLPGDTGGAPLFGTLPVSGAKGGFAFALAKTPDSDWYERLYIDVNADGRIGPEETFQTKAVEKPAVDMHPAGMATPVVSTFVLDMPLDRAAGAPANGVSELRVLAFKENPGHVQIGIFAGGYRQGEATVQGRRYNVRLLDLTADGRFNDTAKKEGDAWLPHDGIVFLPEGMESKRLDYETERLNSVRVLGEEIYEVSVTEDGAEMTWTPSDMPRGRVTMKPAAGAEFCGEKGFFLVRPCQWVVLPAGTYTASSIHYEEAMDDGSTWTLYSQDYNLQPQPIEIEAGKDTTMPYGAPFTSQVTLAGGFRGSVFMSVELKGRCGETYSYTHMRADRYPIPAADVIVKTRGGKVLARVPRSVQHSIDAIPPDYEWAGPVPPDGAVATCNLGLPWKVKPLKTKIPPGRK